MDDRIKETDLTESSASQSDIMEQETSGTDSSGEYFGDILKRRVQRRSVLKGAGALSVGLVLGGSTVAPGEGCADDHENDDEDDILDYDPGIRIRFTSIDKSFPKLLDQDQIVVPDNYTYKVILRWGDGLFTDAPTFDVENQNGDTQQQQFGFNCDFIGFFSLPYFVRRSAGMQDNRRSRALNWLGANYYHINRRPTSNALLAVNHEYTSGQEMFPGYKKDDPSEDQVNAEIAAHGMSVVTIQQKHGDWHFVQDSPFNRRITGFTRIKITGPLSGDPLLQTSGGYDDSGEIVLGMLNNCAGGKTPWGTVLTCEENFDQYFANYSEVPDEIAYLSDRIAPPSGASSRKWENFHDRFDLSKHPKEYHRFGYVVEIDPYNPTFKPKKCTALGRFKHEGAVPKVASNGQVVVYSGDDARFEYVYKFVSAGTYDPHDREHNMNLLDVGTLYVAKFNDDGTGEWMALPQDSESIVNTRGAADKLGATKMDRPEDVDVSPVTGKVYVIMTKNKKRGTGEKEGLQTDPGVDAANPRDNNLWGHIIEITEGPGWPGYGYDDDDDDDDKSAMDHTSTTFHWEVFMLCGDPSVLGGVTNLNDLTADETYFAGFDPSQVSPIAAPDNIVFDEVGNLWIATDGQPGTLNRNDGVYACPTEGPSRGWNRQFISGIPGGEVCGPEFSGDNRSFFCGIQHPGENGGLPNSKSSWPDGNYPPKPSVIAVQHKRDKKIGS